MNPYTNQESVSHPIGPEGVAPLRIPLRLLLPLTVLVAGPLMGWGGYARAGYVTPVSLVSRAPATFFADGAASSDPDDVGPAAGEANPEIDPPYDARDLARFLYVLPPAGPGAGDSSAGAGSQAPVGNAGAAGSSPLPGAASRPHTDMPVLVGALFLKTASRRPPQFPSRIFRPPRNLWV